MKSEINEAIKLLEKNGYVVVQITETMKNHFSECIKSDGGDCSECHCNMCITRINEQCK